MPSLLRKERLDALLTERGLFASREQAQRSVLAGEIWVGQVRLEKPGMRVGHDTPIEVRSRTPRHASRAGAKLEHALETFGISVLDRVCLDVGASTGGFTDCLLQRGARHVFAVDVGFGQLDSKLRSDARVTSLEKTNARYLTQTHLNQADSRSTEIDFVCMDVSFISLQRIVPAVAASAPKGRDWVFLFKPQFEVGPKNLGKGGRVKNQTAVSQALQTFDIFMTNHGFRRHFSTENSPIAGKKSGNTEILLHYEKP